MLTILNLSNTPINIANALVNPSKTRLLDDRRLVGNHAAVTTLRTLRSVSKIVVSRGTTVLTDADVAGLEFDREGVLVDSIGAEGGGGGTGVLTFADVDALRAFDISELSSDSEFVYATDPGLFFKYDEAEDQEDDSLSIIKPDSVDAEDPGRWVPAEFRRFMTEPSVSDIRSGWSLVQSKAATKLGITILAEDISQLYRFDPNSDDVDDGINFIKPADAGGTNGRWIRIGRDLNLYSLEYNNATIIPIPYGRLVTQKTDGTVALCDATSALGCNSGNLAGVAPRAIPAADSCRLVSRGDDVDVFFSPGLNSGTPPAVGQRVYANPAAPGSATNVAPATTGHWVICVGRISGLRAGYDNGSGSTLGVRFDASIAGVSSEEVK